jgi:hypothetical protein
LTVHLTIDKWCFRYQGWQSTVGRNFFKTQRDFLYSPTLLPYDVLR